MSNASRHEFEVGLRFGDCDERLPVAAWLILGEGPDVWWRGLGALRVSLSSLRMFEVTGPVDRDRVGALLVVPDGEDAVFETIQEGGGALVQPLVSFGAVLLPRGATLYPRVTEAETYALFPLTVELLHPRFGRVAFEESDAIRAQDLVRTPAVDESWTFARPGTTLPRSFGPVVARPIDADDLTFERLGAESVSTRPLESLDDGGSRARETLTIRIRNAVRRSFAHAARAYADRAPRTATDETWVNRMERWADGVLQDRETRRRMRSIEALLRELRTDPNSGLRYALPLGQDSSPLKDAGGRTPELFEHATEFDLSHIGAARGGLHHTLEGTLHAQLRSEYERIARADEAAGEHRRAAYVRAHLLHDLRGAAQTLESGGHFREAAILWREKLNEARSAAECFARGGLTDEAVTIYEELEEFRAAGVVLRDAHREREAEAMYRRSVDQKIVAGERVPAADLLDHDLGRVDEALALLRATPIDHHSAPRCMQSWFARLDREGRSIEALPWIESESAALLSREGALAALAETASGLSDASVRERLDDAVRRAAVREGRGGLVPGATHALSRLDRRDRVLARDIARWESIRSDRNREVSSVFAATESTDVEHGEPIDLAEDRTGIRRVIGMRRGVFDLTIDVQRREASLQFIPWSTGHRSIALVWSNVPASATDWCFLPPEEGRFIAWLVDATGGVAMRLELQTATADDGAPWAFGTPESCAG